MVLNLLVCEDFIQQNSSQNFIFVRDLEVQGSFMHACSLFKSHGSLMRVCADVTGSF